MSYCGDLDRDRDLDRERDRERDLERERDSGPLLNEEILEADCVEFFNFSALTCGCLWYMWF